MKSNNWTEKELTLLKAIYSTSSIEELEKKFYRHPYKAIYSKAFELGLKRGKRKSLKGV